MEEKEHCDQDDDIMQLILFIACGGSKEKGEEGKPAPRVI